jgi:glutamate N-acetyltransferase/amino-acid N-acetyltransferase
MAAVLRSAISDAVSGCGVISPLLTRAASTGAFASAAEHLTSLKPHAVLPRGFRIGVQGFSFRPRELPTKPANMNLTLIALDKPTPNFAAMFTSNAFPGAPVIVGRKRLAADTIQAVIINNKISNVCATGGVEDSESLCAAVAKQLGLKSAEQVIPSSTGVIGWKLPIAEMLTQLPSAVTALQADSILPAAKGIMTTDMYPKVRSCVVPGTTGRIVGIAKGAGMIEPNLATMLVYILTDLDIPREALRSALPRAVNVSFNALSIDSDMSTSDTVVLLSSNQVPYAGPISAFERALTQVCGQLSEDIVRNGEGVQHVIRVKVTGATTEALARAVGKSIVNSPLFKCAVAGNDPNVGRLVAAIGKCVGSHPDYISRAKQVDVSQVSRIDMGGINIFSEGQFRLTQETEKLLVKHMKDAQLWGKIHTVYKALPTHRERSARSLCKFGVRYALSQP